MTEEAREARRAYYRDWHKKNPTKDKEYHARYWDKKAKQLQQQEARETPEEAAKEA